jgi:hypothetical protein
MLRPTTAWIVALLLLTATATYMLMTYSSFPAQVPMQWGGGDQPTWYASREVAFKWWATLLGGLNLVMALASTRKPASVGAQTAMLMNGALLFLFHMTYQQIAPQKFMYVSPTHATYITLIVVFTGIAVIIASSWNDRSSYER